jgi:hypothetical protein
MSDLVTALLPAPAGAAQPMAYRQGVIVTFDPATLSNTVAVGGTVLTDLPLLGLAEAVTLAPGDVVGLMSVSMGGASTLGILGQYVTPGSVEAAAAISVPSINTYSANVATFETRTSATWGDLATVGPVVENVRIGPSGRCLVFVTSNIGIQVTNGAGGEVTYAVSGATTVNPTDTPPPLAVYGAAGTSITSTRLALQEGLNAGLHTFTAKYSAVDFGVGGSARFGSRNLTVMAL